jgi:hypothetical protein
LPASELPAITDKWIAEKKNCPQVNCPQSKKTELVFVEEKQGFSPIAQVKPGTVLWV